jgi:hypothetical protein
MSSLISATCRDSWTWPHSRTATWIDPTELNPSESDQHTPPGMEADCGVGVVQALDGPAQSE